jgi:hypothetical protein
MNAPPASAVNGDVFGCGAIARVKNVDFHVMSMSLRGAFLFFATKQSPTQLEIASGYRPRNDMDSFHHFINNSNPSSIDTFG